MVATVAASEGVGLCANASAVTEATAVNASENATNDFFMNTPSACGGDGAHQNGSDSPSHAATVPHPRWEECPIAHSTDLVGRGRIREERLVHRGTTRWAARTAPTPRHSATELMTYRMSLGTDG